MGRKSVWDDGDRNDGRTSLPGPLTVLEQIPVAEQKRSATVTGPQNVTTYRGVPVEVKARVALAAERLGVPAGEVARYLLEYGLQAVENGALRMEPTLAEGRRTLFPPSGWNASSYVPVNGAKRRKKKGGAARVSYRGIPDETVQAVEALASRLVTPIGEVARRLLEFGLEAYEAGNLPMQTYAVVMKNTLYG